MSLGLLVTCDSSLWPSRSRSIHRILPHRNRLQIDWQRSTAFQPKSCQDLLRSLLCLQINIALPGRVGPWPLCLQLTQRNRTWVNQHKHSPWAFAGLSHGMGNWLLLSLVACKASKIQGTDLLSSWRCPPKSGSGSRVEPQSVLVAFALSETKASTWLCSASLCISSSCWGMQWQMALSSAPWETYYSHSCCKSLWFTRVARSVHCYH